MELAAKISKLALPVILGNILNYIEPIMNMISIGRTSNSQVDIAGLGLGMTYLLAVNYTLGIGLS